MSDSYDRPPDRAGQGEGSEAVKRKCDCEIYCRFLRQAARVDPCQNQHGYSGCVSERGAEGPRPRRREARDGEADRDGVFSPERRRSSVRHQ